MPGGGYDPFTDEPGDILYGPSDQFGFTSWAHSDIIKWRWFGNFTAGHDVNTRSLQKTGRKRLAQLQLRIRLGADTNLGMGKQVWQETTGEVITAITRPGHDEVWIESSPGAKEEEERKDLYIPYLWIGARIKAGTALCTPHELTGSPEVRLWVWEPANSAPESARLRSQGPGASRAGATQQHVGPMYDGSSLNCSLGMGTKPGGDATALTTPSVSSAVGSVPMTRLFELVNCDDQEIVLLTGDGFTDLFNDGIYVPTCIGAPLDPGDPGPCKVWLPFDFPVLRFVANQVQQAMAAVHPDAEAGFNIVHSSTYSCQYTDSGLVYLEYPYAYDPLQNLDEPDPDLMWGQVVYMDPEDPIHNFTETLPFAFFGGVVTDTFTPIDQGHVAPSWQLQGVPLPGNYVVQVAMNGYPCCDAFPFGKGGGGATIELEVRLGREPGRTLTTRYEFQINGQSGTFRARLPYGWYGGFSLDDIRVFDTDNEGPCKPTDDNNWWADSLLIDVASGGVQIEEGYFMDGTRPEDSFFEIETYPGFLDKPFDQAAWDNDFCGTCDFTCITGPLNCPSDPCSDFLFLPTASGQVYPAHLIFHRAILICIEPVDGNCRQDVDFLGNPDPYIGRNKPTRIQIVNNCASAGPNQVGDCEPLGNGGTWNIVTDESTWSTFTAEHDWQLGDTVFVSATQSNNVFIAPENAPELASNLFINSSLICPGLLAHEQFLASLGISETVCLDGVEVVTEYLGVAIPPGQSTP